VRIIGKGGKRISRPRPSTKTALVGIPEIGTNNTRVLIRLSKVPILGVYVIFLVVNHHVQDLDSWLASGVDRADADLLAPLICREISPSKSSQQAHGLSPVPLLTPARIGLQISTSTNRFVN
jgi:hypothetical protein